MSSGGLQTFQALRHRSFRLLWCGLLVSAVGTWMQIIGQSLLVLKLTHGSAFALGTVSLVSALSFFLFALIGGSVADQFDKRRLLLVTQTLSMLLAGLLGLLTITHLIQVWMIVGLAFCSGMVLSFDQPARGALVPALVPREDLMNAISLQAIIFNGASTLGPALAGLTIGWIGIAGNFFLNAASFLGVLLALFQIRVPSGNAERSPSREPLLLAIRAVLGTIRRDAVLPWILAGYGTLLFFGPSPALILPIFATQILHLTPFQLGLLFSASGVGTILGALGIAAAGDFPYKSRLFLASLGVWVCALELFGISRVFPLSMLALLIFGMAQNGAGVMAITLMQTRVPPQMRGRVMSLNTLLIMGVRPLGDFPAGILVGLVGAPWTVAAGAGLVGIYGLYLFAAKPVLREPN